MADYAARPLDGLELGDRPPANIDTEISVRSDRGAVRTLALCHWRDASVIINALEIAQRLKPA